MFNKTAQKERIGDIKKSATLEHLKEVEKYFLTAVRKYRIEISYDVIANELPYFKTLNYTEWAHCFMMHPLQQELRMRQMIDAYDDNADQTFDYVQTFADRILNGQSNKYEHIKSAMDKVQGRENLVVLVGSNKLKDRICLNKLKWIRDTHEDEVYFKPHPLTTYQLVGELKDILGKNYVLDRDEDMYAYLTQAETVYTSHMSESAVYAVSLGKTIEPIDVYNKVEQGSFYHINKFLFDSEDHKGDQASPQHKFRKQFNELGYVNLFEDSDKFFRDFIHVDSVINYHNLFFDVAESGLWNIGCGKPKSFFQVANEITTVHRYIKMPDSLKHSYQAYTCADMNKTNNTLEKYAKNISNGTTRFW